MDISYASTFGEVLKAFRLRAKLSQRQLAERLGIHPSTLGEWERGEVLPFPQYKIAEIVRMLNLNEQDTKLLLATWLWPGLFQENSSGSNALPTPTDFTNTIRIRITQDPLTAQNLTTIVSSLTELTTKYWLIAKGRFADLIEYTQTHNDRFAEEANAVITRVSYNSPFNMDWKVDLSAPSVAEALVTTLDGITQRQERLEKAKLENQAQAIAIKEAEQKAEQDTQMALLEQEKHRLELEQRRLEVLEKQLEVQKKGIEYALEIAGKVIDTLHPGADAATRAMEIQALLPNLIQLQNGKGLELALPTPQKSTE